MRIDIWESSWGKLSKTRFLRGYRVVWGWHSAEVEYGAHIWTGRRLRVKTKTLGGGSRDFEFREFYPTFSVNPHWIGFWKCQHFASCLFCFSKMRKWKIRKWRKVHRKTKSRVHELYFGTIISRKLPVGFENGSNEVHDLDLVLVQNTKCLASPNILAISSCLLVLLFVANTKPWSRTSNEPFSKPSGSFLPIMVPK